MTSLDVKQIYEQSCNFLRHYSGLILKVRTLTFAQGFLVLSACILLLKEKEQDIARYVAIGGLILTIVFERLHWNYLKYFMSTQEYLQKLEENYFVDQNIPGLLSVIESERNERLNKWYNRLMVIYGPFLIIVLGFLVIIFVSI